MTADVELLPLPKWLLEGFTDPTIERLRDYTRSCVAHATAAKDAEIERLRAEMDRWKSNYNAAIELKGRAFAESERLAETLRAERRRLAESLRAQRRWWVARKAYAIREEVGGLTRGDPEAVARCDAAIQRIDALRDHDQEGGE